MAPRTVQAITDDLTDLSDEINRHVEALEDCYARRNVLYSRGLMLGMKQVELAAAARSTPEAVGKAIAKIRQNGG